MDKSRRRRICIAALISIFVATLASANSLPARAAESLSLEGHGFGHGRGLGQYGALGYALNFAWDHRRILEHYYGGTGAGNAGNPAMTIRLTRFDGVDAYVYQERGRLLTGASPGNTFFALRVARIGQGQFRVDSAPSCSGPWSTINSAHNGLVWMAPQIRNDDVGEMLSVCEPDGTRRFYRGDIHVTDDSAGSARTLNYVDTENYLKGVVPRESPASWGDLGGGAGMHALRAQSVAARSYSLSENRYSYAKTCDSTACQVYGGRAVLDGSGFRDLEDGRTNRAIAETAGEVRLKDGQPARAEFSSSTGGWSAGGAFPAVPDEGDAVASNPHHLWQATVSSAQIEASWPEIGALRTAWTSQRNGVGDWGGRVLGVTLEGTTKTIVVSGATFRSRLGLKSDWFRFVDSWGAWESLQGVLTSGPDAASWSPNRLDVFAKGSDGQVHHRWWDGAGWQGWEPMGGGTNSDPGAESWAPGRIDIFIRGTDDQLWHKWYDSGWSHWEPLGGILRSGPDVASWGPGRLDILVKGSDDQLWHKWYDGQWSHWEPLGGLLTSDPGATSWGPNRIDVFARGTDNGLWHKWWDGSQWQGWEGVGGTLSSAPDVASWGAGRLDVFVGGTDRGLWRKTYEAGWGEWQPLGGVTSFNPTATSWGTRRIDLFVTGTDGSLWHRWLG